MADSIAIPPDARTVAFVGVAKNAGKTTALRHVMARELDGGRRVGVVSIGLDGESFDKLSGAEKPTIHLPRGHLVVTAADAARESPARFEYLEPLGFETPLGRTLLLRVREPGDVVFAGIRHRNDLQTAVEALDGAGADRVVVDGAYGRTLVADGRVADAVVLATGAVAGRSPTAVADQTAPFVETLRLSAPTSELHRRAARRARDLDSPVCATPEGRIVADSTGTAVDGLDFDDVPRIECVALPGAVTDSTADTLGGLAADDPTLIVPAASHLQLSHDAWRTMRRRWKVTVTHPIELVGLASNPIDPEGDDLDPRRLWRHLSETFPEVAVEDVVHRYSDEAS